MAKWTISKFFSLIVFLLMMAVLFFWMINQVTDLSLLFGFRTSHTAANDLASLITSVGGVPGIISTVYEIKPGENPQQEKFQYDIDILDKVVCVSSYLGNDQSRSTSDCASHPYDLKKEYFCQTVGGKITLKITKTIEEGEVNIGIESVEGRCEELGT